MVFKGGKSGNEEWTDELRFKRYSWLQELSLVHEIMITEIDFSSPFARWFSEGERQTLENCSRAYISLQYTIDSNKIAPGEYIKQMQDQGYQRIFVPNFKSYFKLHPNFDHLNLKLYELSSFCLEKGRKAEQISLDLPGFDTVIFK